VTVVGRSLAAAAVVSLFLTGCGAATPSASADPWDAVDGQLRDLPPDIERAEGRPGPEGGIVIAPSSVQIDEGEPYRFSLGHCGLGSPVDVDGSFWEAVEGFDATGEPIDLESDVDTINATPGIIVVIGDEARFRTESGKVIRLERIFGEPEFMPCD